MTIIDRARPASDYRAPADPKTDPIGAAIDHGRTRLLVEAGSFNVRAEAARAYRAGQENALGTPTPMTGIAQSLPLAAPFDLKAHFDHVRAKIPELRNEAERLEFEIASHKNKLEAFEAARVFLESDNVSWERPSASIAHKLFEEIDNNAVLGYLDTGEKLVKIKDNDVWQRIRQDMQVFVIEHNWADAFSKADIIEGEVRFPYKISCFEMRVNGRHILYIVDETSNYLAMLCGSLWIYFISSQRATLTVAKAIETQVRAVCISLDAEVAKAEIVRAPHKLNHAREKAGKLPLYDYHVVSLVRRVRAEPMTLSDEPVNRKRLHWRRGHWRHFANHKTWIRWQLVGNSDIGFVDKHYRL